MQKRIDYQHLKEWMILNDFTQKEMSDIAGISPATLSLALNNGTSLHGRVLMAWLEAFDWGYDQMCFLCLNGPYPEEKIEKTQIVIDLEDLLKLVDNIKK